MLFSIVVPIYKVEDCLIRCIDSLVKQTFTDIEIILVDDGSPDSCPQICDEYAERDSRIRVLHKENGGLSDARNKGVEVASGEYIIFVDSDDYIALDTCEKLTTFTQEKPDIIIIDSKTEGQGGVYKHAKELYGKLMTGREYLKQAYEFGKAPMAAWLNVFHRDFLIHNNLQFKKGLLHEDEQFTPRAFLQADKIVYSGIDAYRYVIRDGSITMCKDLRKNAEHLFATLEELYQIYINLSDKKLKKFLLDSLAMKYLIMFQRGNLQQYGKKYIKKAFVFKNAKRIKTKLKALLFCVSPKMYIAIHHYVKG